MPVPDQTCFRPAATGTGGSATPIKLSEVGTTMLLWNTERPLGFNYAPFMVHTTVFTDTQLVFQFIDCQTKAPFGDTHTIALPDFDFAHAAFPSLLPSALDMSKGRQAGILFLNLEEWARPPESQMTKVNWDKLAKQASDSNPAPPIQGKWPRSADLGVITDFENLKADYVKLFAQQKKLIAILRLSHNHPTDVSNFENFLNDHQPPL